MTTIGDDAGIAPRAPLQALGEWEAAGLVEPGQGERIRVFEAARETRQTAGMGAPAPARQSVLIEALSYVGGAIIAAGLLMVTFGYWESLDVVWQISIPAVATAVLLLSGLLVPSRYGPVAGRLRGALWMVSTATFAGLLIVLAYRWEWEATVAPRVVAAVTLGYALALWLAHRGVTQQLAAFVAAMLLGIALVIDDQGSDSTVVGATMAAVALAWGVASRAGLLPGAGRFRTAAAEGGDRWSSGAAQRRAGMLFGAIGAGIGAIALAAGDASWAGVIPVVLVLIAAVALTDVVMVVVGAVAALVVLPMVADYYLRSTLAVAVVLLVTGALLVALAVGMLRRRTVRDRGMSGPPPPRQV